MRRIVRQLVGFIKGLFGKPKFSPGRVEDTPEMEFEIERKRGVRGF